MKWSPRRRYAAIGILGAMLVALPVFQRQLFRGNFGVVVPERVFRSARPGGRLTGLIRVHRLASVLNLVAGSSADPWYADEVRAARDAGVDFYDFPISAVRRPSRGELLVLIDLFSRCRYPLLIHCKSGSDRTGLASALYLMTGSGVEPEAAGREFSLFYGHMPVGPTTRLHAPLTEYRAWLVARGAAHSAARFRHWVEHNYPDDQPGDAFRPLRPGPRHVVARTGGGGRSR